MHSLISLKLSATVSLRIEPTYFTY